MKKSNETSDVTDQDSKEQREEMLRKMSRELVKGSIMLQDGCPVCNTPLMQKKDSNQIYCFSCKKQVVREKDLDRTTEGHKQIDSRSVYYPYEKAESEYTGKLLSMIAGKLESQLFKIAEEENLDELEKKLNIAERLANLMKTLKEIQN